MSQAHVEKFYDIVAKDPALLATLDEGTNSSEEFLARVVAAAKTQGLEFTAQEAREYVDSQMVNHTDGELTDQQLEAVAGGAFSDNLLTLLLLSSSYGDNNRRGHRRRRHGSSGDLLPLLLLGGGIP